MPDMCNYDITHCKCTVDDIYHRMTALQICYSYCTCVHMTTEPAFSFFYMLLGQNQAQEMEKEGTI